MQEDNFCAHLNEHDTDYFLREIVNWEFFIASHVVHTEREKIDVNVHVFGGKCFTTDKYCCPDKIKKNIYYVNIAELNKNKSYVVAWCLLFRLRPAPFKYYPYTRRCDAQIRPDAVNEMDSK